MSEPSDHLDPGSPTGRYARQVVYQNVGPEGQRRLARSHVVLIGCGAMGGMQANLLVRAGVGSLRIVDRDVVELDNLQRQVLFDETDAANNRPKAEAACDKLAAINADVRLQADVVDLDAANVESLVHGADLLLDGTDNFETRFLINDAAVKLGLPWIYGGVVADQGTVLTILPGETPCLRCLFPDPSALTDVDTCLTVGVLGSTVAVVASLQAVEAIKILTGQVDAVSRRCTSIDVWAPHFAVDAVPARSTDCPCCAQRRFEFLEPEPRT